MLRTSAFSASEVIDVKKPPERSEQAARQSANVGFAKGCDQYSTSDDPALSQRQIIGRRINVIHADAVEPKQRGSGDLNLTTDVLFLARGRCGGDNVSPPAIRATKKKKQNANEKSYDLGVYP